MLPLTFPERVRAERAMRLALDEPLPASVAATLLQERVDELTEQPDDERISMAKLEETQAELDEARREAVSFRDALDQIHALMDGREWNADTLDAIAEVLHASGYAIHDSEDVTLPGVGYTER